MRLKWIGRLVLGGFSMVLAGSGLEGAALRDCTERGLREAMAAGGVIQIACDHSFLLSSPLVVTNAVTLDGAGHRVVLSAERSGRIFEVTSGGHLTLRNLTVKDGRAPRGGAIWNEGFLEAENMVFAGCKAVGVASSPWLLPAVPGSAGEGGALWNSGRARLDNCRLEGNLAIGGAGPLVDGDEDVIIITAGAHAGRGGAIYNQSVLAITRCEFTNNFAVGGRGNPLNTSPALPAGQGAVGLGGALYCAGTSVVQQTLFVMNGAYGGAASGSAHAGDGQGGAIASLGVLGLTNSTVTQCEALGGLNPEADSAGGGYGGGVAQLHGVADIAFCTMAYDYASGGSGRLGACLYSAGAATARVTHSIFAYSRPFVLTPPPNVSGPVIDLGYNIGTDTNAVFGAAGSRNGVDPLLGPLADNGGPTATMSLQAGSPGVDSGAPGAPVAIDQRGWSRPWGARTDVGAVEGVVLPPVSAFPMALSAMAAGESTNVVLVISNANRGPLTQVSIDYYPPATFTLGAPEENDCSWPLFADTLQVVLTGVDLAPGEACHLKVPVHASIAGVWPGASLYFNSDQTGPATYRVPEMVTVLDRPIVTTLPVTSATAGEAMLNARANPGGLDTLVWFEYGFLSNELAQSTAPENLAGSYAATPWTSVASGFPSNALFYYRAVGSNAVGIAFGQVRTGYTLGDQVVACEEGNLAVSAAAGGRVRFACAGILTLAAPLVVTNDLELEADGHQIVISGGTTSGLFQVRPGARLTLRGLTLADARATNGAAVLNEGDFNAIGCTFSGNVAQGDGNSVPACGGAVWNVGTALLLDCLIADNAAVGGPGPAGVVSGQIAGAGRGGAVGNFGTLVISNCTLRSNRASGGHGTLGLANSGLAGVGEGGGIFNAHQATVLNSSLIENVSQGGGAGSRIGAASGGDGFGGAIFSTESLFITNSTLFRNFAAGGHPDFPSLIDGSGYGGAVLVATGAAVLAFCTLAENGATNGGTAVLVRSNALAVLDHSVFAPAGGAASLLGAIEDAGYNFTGDAAPALTNDTSHTLAAVALGPLADNGGGTWTMALRAGSEVIDQGGPTLTPAIDQRGAPRPSGAAVDAGAYEGVLGPPSLTLELASGRTIALSETTTLRLDVANTNQSPLGLAFTNHLGPGLVVNGSAGTSPDFAGTVSAPLDGHEIVTAIFLPALRTNWIEVSVRAVAVGSTVVTVPSVIVAQYGSDGPGVAVEIFVGGRPHPELAPAGNATFTGVQLNGTVTTGGSESWAWFEYGPSPELGARTIQQLVTDLTQPVAITQGIEDLASGTDYFYRVVASNELGVAASPLGAFFTLGDINTCDDAHVRVNLARGGRVRFGCNGVISLSNALTVASAVEVDADDHRVILDGGGANRILEIESGIAVTLRGLTISNGLASVGGGILNRGSLVLDRCSLVGNRAVGTNGARGANGADALPRPPAPPATGEAGYPGEAGGPAAGGGLANRGWCYLLDTFVAGNQALGGDGGDGGNAGQPNTPGAVLISGGAGGPAGPARGGGLDSEGVLTISNSCVVANESRGGRGGMGGQNLGGSLAPGGVGGLSWGGGIAATGRLDLINATVAENDAQGGPVGAGTAFPAVLGGDAFGGGLHLDGEAQILNGTVAGNRVAGTAGGAALGGNIFSLGAGLSLRNTILSHGLSQTNLVGLMVDGGHNLSSDGSVSFSEATSRGGIDPRLGALDFYGGRTPSFTLLPMSPALDAGVTDAPAFDQRGQPRPALGGIDIGAHEVQPTVFGIQSIVAVAPGRFRLRGFGIPGAEYRVLGAPDDAVWSPIGAGVVDGSGLFEVEIDTTDRESQILRISAP